LPDPLDAERKFWRTQLRPFEEETYDLRWRGAPDDPHPDGVVQSCWAVWSGIQIDIPLFPPESVISLPHRDSGRTECPTIWEEKRLCGNGSRLNGSEKDSKVASLSRRREEDEELIHSDVLHAQISNSHRLRAGSSTYHEPHVRRATAKTQANSIACCVERSACQRTLQRRFGNDGGKLSIGRARAEFEP
jgi:hypothetical protein